MPNFEEFDFIILRLKFFLYTFGFSRMGLGSHIVLRGTIRDVMKGCRGFKAISSVMWLGNNVLG